MNTKVIIAGGGIGGLACALALGRQGVRVQLLEQAGHFSEVGAGIQLGPNAVRVLTDWGLRDALMERIAQPHALHVRDAASGRRLGWLRFGRMLQRYGEPYTTIHRADLHALLLAEVQRLPTVSLQLDSRVVTYQLEGPYVRVKDEAGRVWDGEALIGCDGLWSQVRVQMLGAQPVRASGHLAYRGTIAAARLPERLRRPLVMAWLGPGVHVVHYPVRGGELFNVVAVVEGVIGHGHGGEVTGDIQSWSHEAYAEDLHRCLAWACPELMDMVKAVSSWKLWALNDRVPMKSAHEHAQGRVALLGDAAHPLRPYLAQGAAMALEDAWTLGRLVMPGSASAASLDWPILLHRYARTRWRRNARVQRRSALNGVVFHADGLTRHGRDLAMGMLGEWLLDNPWLYEGPPDPEKA